MLGRQLLMSQVRQFLRAGMSKRGKGGVFSSLSAIPWALASFKYFGGLVQNSLLFRLYINGCGGQTDVPKNFLKYVVRKPLGDGRRPKSVSKSMGACLFQLDDFLGEK